MSRRWTLRAGIRVLATWMMLTVSSSAFAVTTSWNTNSSGFFTTAANWDNGIPDSDDTAVFNRGAGVVYTVTFPGGSIFDPPPNYVIDYLRVRANDVTFNDNSSPFMTLPSLTVANPANPNVSIVIGHFAGDVAVLNTLLYSLSGVNTSIGYFTGSEGTLNVNSGTFSMSGAIYVGDSGTGTLNVTGTASVSALSLVSVGRFGTGTLNVTGGSVSNGFIQVGEFGNGTLNINVGGSVSGGTISVGLSGTGTLNVTDGGTLSSIDSFIGAESGSSGTATVSGAGSLWNTNNFNLIIGYLGAGMLTIENGGQVSIASGGIGTRPNSTGTVTVAGTNAVWNLFGRLSIGGSADSGVPGGSGTLNIDPGGTVLVAQDVVLFSDGLVKLQGGNLAALAVSFQGGGQFNWTSGTFQVDTFNGDLVNQGGTLLPGSANLTTIVGNYTQQSAGAMEFAISGTTPVTDFNQVTVDDVASLDGTLDVSLRGNFTPGIGDTFDIISATGGRSGTFANEGLPMLPGNRDWNVIYGANSVTLEVVAGLAGDYNDDSSVDAADYVVWRKNDGAPAGYNEWRAHFGQPGGSGSGATGSAGANTAIPEPATAVMLTFATAVWCLRRVQAA